MTTSRRQRKASIDEKASNEYIASAIDSHIAFARKNNRTFRIFANESNGILALPILQEKGVRADFCYIKSTHLESKKTSAVIESLPDNLLSALARGAEVLVVDYGALKDRSRAIYQGVPFIKYVIDRTWYDIDPTSVIIYPRKNDMSHSLNTKNIFSEWYDTLSERAIERIQSFKRSAVASASNDASLAKEGVRLTGVSAATKHDSDKDLFFVMKKKYLEAAG